MGKTAPSSAKRKASKDSLFADPVAPFPERWYGKLLLLLAATALLTLAYAPINQFYLAWIGLVPWLVAIAHCRSYKAAVFWGWLGGTMFFIANMWWMAYVTGPGMVGLMAILAAYWGIMGAVVRFGFRQPGLGLRPEMLLVAFAWVSLEFIRGNFIWKGLPWLYLGHTQTPALAMVQIADVLGVYGVSFWVVLINVVIAAWWLSEKSWPTVRRGVVYVIALTAGLMLYGVWRITSTVTTPGPTVIVVQPNYPQSNTGEKGASEQETFAFHHRITGKALVEHPQADLVVWSETIMPPFNRESLQHLSELGYPQLTVRAAEYALMFKTIQQLAAETNVGLMTGMLHVDRWWVNEEGYLKSDKRNSVVLFERDGTLVPLRYDKIHIVPFGEFIPFRTIPWIYNTMVRLGPPHMDEYNLIPGDDDALIVFPLRKSRSFLDLSTWRLAPSICFEDIDSALTARMFRPTQGDAKRADVLVNFTNDGWFKANEMSQHLQVARFRSIENRVPTARAVNTGISGFIDSVGRVKDYIPAGTEGYAVAQLHLDPRLTFYTRYGDVFAWICIGASVSMILVRVIGRRS
jgi:apolipoprotein N-acyltransferase